MQPAANSSTADRSHLPLVARLQLTRSLNLQAAAVGVFCVLHEHECTEIQGTLSLKSETRDLDVP